ncbi:hypothetical protein [Dactylosporangium sp. CA-139066]|uniref:hypothetical protein n=1 Tax=Dactylosporangium sp. CA-139066 TaxID=3239930 RepID=UPI003D8DE6C1
MHLLTAVAQTTADHLHILAAPEPSGAPTPKELNTDGILNFFVTKIVPILLAGLGIIFVSRANKGEVSKVLTSSSVALIGIAFIAGATSLFFFGGSIVDLLFK